MEVEAVEVVMQQDVNQEEVQGPGVRGCMIGSDI